MAFLLVAATFGKQYKKGEFLFIKKAGVYGKKERLPDWLRIEIPGSTVSVIKQYDSNWVTTVEFTNISENDISWRIKLQVNTNIIARNNNLSPKLKPQLKNWILGLLAPHAQWAATLVSQTDTELVVDLLKDGISLSAWKTVISNRFIDKQSVSAGVRKFYLPESDVDAIVTKGVALEIAAEDAEGRIPKDLIHDTLTRSQLANRMIDRRN